ncbi:LysR family transcriptional regulator [Shewanella gelidii]|uniref:Transcriptional regulator n=1 Tax=Shewanella gelidii TaxID=1642821 RepID=A0A917JMA3_9GAMM|nr:LysR family transcriptional regulator [Shewanella gelidii]MCL1096935.1 LysR family transcriptional regulator [Shewanella gelidii]GGI71346.1 transcriptional regulator [Shewanella gelidii]
MLHSKIDLNLFLVLATVYQEGSITAAAHRLHLTQPAISHALSRLRKKYDDPLFIRQGRKMIPSALCQQMLPDVVAALQLLNGTFTLPAEFDMTKQQRTVKMGMRDILETTFFPQLVTDLQTNTPNIAINSFQVNTQDFDQALMQQDVDMIIDVLTPTQQEIRSQLICNEGFSLVCRTNHPILNDLSLTSYASATHALAAQKGAKVNIVDMALAQHQISRNIALQCEHYIAAVSVITRCDMIMTLPNTYAHFLQGKFPIAIAPLPFEVPPLPIHLYWHQRAELDPINNWLREKIINIAKERFGSPDA